MLIIKYGIKIKRFVSANKDIHFINQLKTVLDVNLLKDGIMTKKNANVILLNKIYANKDNAMLILIKFGIVNKLLVYVNRIFIETLIKCASNVEQIKFGIVNYLFANAHNNFKKLMEFA